MIGEREIRAAKRVARQSETVDWLSVIPQIQISQLVAEELREEEAKAEKKMAEIAAKDRDNAARLGFNTNDNKWEMFLRSPDAVKVRSVLLSDPVETVESARIELAKQQEIIDQTSDKSVNTAIDKANRRRQKASPGNRKHPIVQREIIPERRMEKLLHPKPRKPADENWKLKIINSRGWKEALRWFNMAPAERSAEMAKIEDAINTETGAVARAAANQAEWNALEESGALEQMDFFGFSWPTD